MRIDHYLVANRKAPTRSQAESLIALGLVTRNGRQVTKNGEWVGEADRVVVKRHVQYVSRAGLKLASVATSLNLQFKGKIVLDVGSSTGGFTDYSLRAGAKKVTAVDVGSNQLDPRLRADPRIELHEQTDIRDVHIESLSDRHYGPGICLIVTVPDIILIDASFISLRELLPHIRSLCGVSTEIVAMVKPQFEAGVSFKHKGVIKNDRMRRDILHDFELWLKNNQFIVRQKADSEVVGMKGNRERFYLLVPTQPSKGRISNIEFGI